MLRYSIGVRFATVGSLAFSPQLVAKAIILAGLIGELVYFLAAAGKVAEARSLNSATKVLKELELTNQTTLVTPLVILTMIVLVVMWTSCEVWYALLLNIVLTLHLITTWWLLYGWRHVEGN